FALFIIFHIVGYYILPSKNKSDKISMSIALTYMNFTLAIYIASEFFADVNILLVVLLSIIPWSICIIPFNLLLRKRGS
ncbi:hypothetical protein KJ855_02315, partial [Patescibacteria group bacterium]|nr:hypothetical protein [Patescibacteria group bacterium]